MNENLSEETIRALDSYREWLDIITEVKTKVDEATGLDDWELSEIISDEIITTDAMHVFLSEKGLFKEFLAWGLKKYLLAGGN